ncbi:MAG: HAD family hydrolase, partial [Anaerolineales bacterium]
MPLTLLLDLDDTLLDSNMDAFVPAYLKNLAGFLVDRAKPQQVIRELLVGRSLMFENERPDLTLDDVFNQYFYPALGIDYTELQSELDRFYDDFFPSLKEFSTPRPAAVEMVEYAFEKGWRVVIATNPVFPLKTIEHRLRWANLPPEKYPFAMITAMETSHFAKSGPAYYAEILGRLGWPSGPVLMVGDEPILDMDSASKAGLPVFWVRPEGKSLPELAQGTLRDFCEWIQAVNLNLLQPDLKKPEALISSLQSGPAVFDSLIRTLKPAEWIARPLKDEWA